MSAIQSLKDFLGDRPHPYMPSTAQFLELDLGKLAKEYRLETVGAERGKEHVPAASAISLDDVESQITTRIESERRACHDKYQSELATFDQRLTALNILSRFTSVQTATRSAISEFSAEVSKGGNELTHARDGVIDAKKYKAFFREENKLRRPADFPESRLLHWGFVLVLLGIETGLNATFLAVGNDLGFLGGLSQALVIALINVGISLFVGQLLFPQKNHIKISIKTLTFLTLVFYGFAIFAFNLSVAHFRGAASSGTLNAGSVALKTLIESPFGVKDFESWIMVILGCLFAGLALADGYRMDDAYPGYGKATRLHKGLFDEYIAQYTDLIDRLRDILNTYTEILKDTRDDLGKRRREHDHILTNRTRLINLYHDHLGYLEKCANNLLTIYRTANRRARSEDTGPQHFDQHWSLPKSESPEPAPESLAPDELKNAITKTDAALEGAIATLHDAFETAIATYKPIDGLGEG